MNETNEKRRMFSARLDEKTRQALEKRAQELGTSQANAIGVALGSIPESVYAKADRKGNTITR